jgi:hypothetical protein
MTPTEKKQLKQNLVMFAKARDYLEKQGLVGVYSMGYQLSWATFSELFEGQFKKKTERIDDYMEYEVKIDGHTFFGLKHKDKG